MDINFIPIVRLFRRTSIRIVSVLFLLLTLSYLLIPLPSPLFKKDYSTEVLDKDGTILRLFLNQHEQWCFPPDPSTPIPEKLKQTVLFFEDKYFPYHPGVNPVSLARTIFQNITSGHIVSGASTITMQTARLMQPKSRTFTHKVLEILQAFKMELRYSKAKILSAYLNHAPYGGNIVGYRAASLRYFRKRPRELTWAEAAVLAVLPNAPALISPLRSPDQLKKKRDRLLSAMFKSGFFNKETFTLAVAEEIPRLSYAPEVHAPHLSRRLKAEYPGRFILRSTIDLTLQQTVEEILLRRKSLLNAHGIRNMAALVVETQSGAVRAYAGSADFKQAQVDGLQAPRSTGSILKPFLYALSMDDGLLLPQTLIKDIPTYFGPFSPSNADKAYRGIVSAKQALIQSLNVPAVRLLNKYGLDSFYYFLKQAGLSTLFRRAEEYGLPLIIGGAEATPWDIATLYRGLARGGRFSSLHILTRPENLNTDRALISSGAAWLTLNMLNEVKRPGNEYYWKQYSGQRPLAWKTGTSYGQRDAWAAGVNPQWTIVVWAGNFSGEGNAGLSGAGTAGPLLFDIFNHLPKNGKESWFPKPDSALTKVEICRQSGFAAGPFCQDKIQVDAPLYMKPLALCPFHKQLTVSEDEKEQVCSLCWKPGHKKVLRLLYPPQVEQFLRQNGSKAESAPPHRRSCPAPPVQNPLTIIYPGSSASIFLPRDFDGSLQKLNCRAAHQQQGQMVYWYLDDHYLGSTRERHEKALRPGRGWHNLLLIDQDGHKAQTRFYIHLQ